MHSDKNHKFLRSQNGAIDSEWRAYFEIVLFRERTRTRTRTQDQGKERISELDPGREEMAFSFAFAGDDIEEDDQQQHTSTRPVVSTTAAPAASASAAGAFPVQGKPLLPPAQHNLHDLLARLPSKIAFSLLDVNLGGDNESLPLPRRELWDVRVQLMAEDGTDTNASESEAGLGEHDVKTGIYEGGFKSWESSVDLVKVLANERVNEALAQEPCVLIEVRMSPVLFMFPILPSAQSRFFSASHVCAGDVLPAD